MSKQSTSKMHQIEFIFSKIWRFLFARPWLYWLNYRLYHLSLRGMGILNYESDLASGEKWLRQYIQKSISPKVVLDVGAFSSKDVLQIHHDFPQALIIGFEPNPSNYKGFKEIVLPKGVNVYPIALGNQPGSMKMWRYEEESVTEHSSFYQEAISVTQRQKAGYDIVPVMVLDDFVKKSRIKKIDFLKIDTEGHELAVLQGARKCLHTGKISCIQFEFNTMNVFSKSFFYDFKEELNDYLLFRLFPSGLLELKEYDVLSQEIFAFQNIFAIHKRQISRFK